MLQALNHSRIPVLADADVLVVGAGSAGCCAAIAAGESGAGVVLVERYGFLGGASSGVLDTFYGFFTPGPSPRKVVGGLPGRVVDALAQAGQVYLRANTYGAGTGVTYNPERLKLVWDQLTAAAGVRVIHHALLIDVQTAPDGRTVGGVFASKSGLFAVAARRFIDASGDADLCHLAGIAYEKAGDLDPAQTLTTTFRFAGVDVKAFEAAGGKKMLAERTAAAVESGRHKLPRKKGSAHEMVIPGCTSTVAARVSDVDATSVVELSVAESEGRRQAFAYEAFFRDDVPGYENARIVGLSVGIGVRETRRVYGEYRLTRDDCLTARQFADAVLLCGAPIEDHRAGGAGTDGQDETAWAYVEGNKAYGVPYGTLVPKGRDELWVVGRCFSATHDAHASCRSMAQTMAMGQAAGIAAAMSMREDCSARAVDIARLRTSLADAGVVLEMPKTVARTAADAWAASRTVTALGHGPVPAANWPDRPFPRQTPEHRP